MVVRASERAAQLEAVDTEKRYADLVAKAKRDEQEAEAQRRRLLDRAARMDAAPS